MNILKIIEKNTYLGQKLYTPILGVCYIKEITKWDEIVMSSSDDPCERNAKVIAFNADGRVLPKGEILLFPSKGMRDWEKVSWKKGDTLQSSTTNQIVTFKDWDSDEYLQFKAYDENNNLNIYRTENFNKIKPEEKLRPGQKVLVRSYEIEPWSLDFFSHYDSMNRPICIGNRYFNHLIVYKGNQSLLGTTKSK